MSKIKVWGRFSSSNVKKVMWLADELALDVERVDAGRQYGVVNTPAYKALNPNSKVPTIEDGDFVLWESNSIMRYFCMKYGGEAFYPADPATRADIDRWLDWSLSILVPVESPLFLGTIRTPPEKQDKAMIAASTEKLADIYGILERRLAGRDYLVKDFSIADIGLSVFADRWLRNPYLPARPPSPQLSAWIARIRPRHGFQKFVDVPLE
ncbi:MAG TPA: glutathione S-transferase family protein [Xanthobacteraceae bacterium]|nr:glutathione S-transferase family protein [Xanthobacteraceae bacterium]